MGTDWPTIVTAIVALYGAVLSTLNALSNRRDKLRCVKAELKWGIIPYMSGTSSPMFFLSASNPGLQTVTITGCGILLPNKKQIVSIQAEGEVRLPYSLEGGKSCTFWMPIPEVVDATKRAGLVGTVSIRAFFRDANGKEYYSKPFKGNVSEWAKVR